MCPNISALLGWLMSRRITNYVSSFGWSIYHHVNASPHTHLTLYNNANLCSKKYGHVNPLQDVLVSQGRQHIILVPTRQKYSCDDTKTDWLSQHF